MIILPRTRQLFLLLAIVLSVIRDASAAELCIYRDSDGRVVQVRGIKEVPSRFRRKAECFDETVRQRVARPEEIELKGTVAERSLVSSVGPIELRWPRQVERYIGKAPSRAVSDAARTVSRALKSKGFPSELRSLRLEWSIIFLDAELPTTQLPYYLHANCHPGWMTPPANIYIVAQRVVGGCGGSPAGSSRAGDAKLAQVLIHEMGHVIEFHLLQGWGAGDRGRAEGFASWFEQFAAEHSAVIPSGKVAKQMKARARKALVRSPNSFIFRGTAEDYARASMVFSAIVERRGVRELIRIYSDMVKERTQFLPAAMKRLNWSEDKLREEILRVVGET